MASQKPGPPKEPRGRNGVVSLRGSCCLVSVGIFASVGRDGGVFLVSGWLVPDGCDGWVGSSNRSFGLRSEAVARLVGRSGDANTDECNGSGSIDVEGGHRCLANPRPFLCAGEVLLPIKVVERPRVGIGYPNFGCSEEDWTEPTEVVVPCGDGSDVVGCCRRALIPLNHAEPPATAEAGDTNSGARVCDPGVFAYGGSC